MVFQFLEGIAEAVIGGFIVAGIIYGINYIRATTSAKNYASKPTVESKETKVGAEVGVNAGASVKVGTRYSVPKVIIGLALIMIGILCIIYGYQTWGFAFNFKNFTNSTNAGAALTNSLTTSFEGVGLEAVGIVLIIAGGLLINKQTTLRIMQVVYESYSK
jgi:hypothetical protein